MFHIGLCKAGDIYVSACESTSQKPRIINKLLKYFIVRIKKLILGKKTPLNRIFFNKLEQEADLT